MKNVMIFLFLSCVLVSTGCGGYVANYAPNGIVPAMMAVNATLNTGDAVNDRILKFELHVSSVALVGMFPTMTSTNLLSKPAEVEFVHQAGTFEPLALVNIPAGTYSGATLTVSNPEVVVLNSGVPASVPANLSSTTVMVIFFPAITITNSSVSIINFDLDLAGSVTLNGSPVASATVTPKFNVTTSSVTTGTIEDSDSGEIEDVHGSVTNISAPNFTVQTSQATITFASDIYTVFRDGVAQLSDLKVGDIVEVDGVTEMNGTKLATKVAKEGGSTGEEVEGIITTVTGSPAVGLTIADQLDSTGTAPRRTTVDIAVNSGTVFSVRTDKLNLSSVQAFDATHIGKGQRVEADSATAGFPTIATELKLREQALVGTVAVSPAPVPSGFTLNISPMSAFGILSGATSVAVTVPNGATLKMAPTAGAMLLVRGLVFVNGTTYTMIATRGDHD
jgi:hypothetical protein